MSVTNTGRSGGKPLFTRKEACYLKCNDNRYMLISSDTPSKVGEAWTVKPNETVTFTMVFEPLPVGSQPFDLIHSMRRYCLYGVRNK